MEFNLSLSDRVLTGDRKAIAIDPENIFKPGVVSGIPKISPDTQARNVTKPLFNFNASFTSVNPAKEGGNSF